MMTYMLRLPLELMFDDHLLGVDLVVLNVVGVVVVVVAEEHVRGVRGHVDAVEDLFPLPVALCILGRHAEDLLVVLVVDGVVLVHLADFKDIGLLVVKVVQVVVVRQHHGLRDLTA